jgi:hypothetical protein
MKEPTSSDLQTFMLISVAESFDRQLIANSGFRGIFLARVIPFQGCLSTRRFRSCRRRPLGAADIVFQEKPNLCRCRGSNGRVLRRRGPRADSRPRSGRTIAYCPLCTNVSSVPRIPIYSHFVDPSGPHNRGVAFFASPFGTSLSVFALEISGSREDLVDHRRRNSHHEWARCSLRFDSNRCPPGACHRRLGAAGLAEKGFL